MFEKYTKPCHNSLFSSAIKNDTEKIFVTMVGLIKTKFDIINGKLYQTSGIINLNKIKNWKTFCDG